MFNGIVQPLRTTGESRAVLPLASLARLAAGEDFHCGQAYSSTRRAQVCHACTGFLATHLSVVYLRADLWSTAHFDTCVKSYCCSCAGKIPVKSAWWLNFTRRDVGQLAKAHHAFVGVSPSMSWPYYRTPTPSASTKI